MSEEVIEEVVAEEPQAEVSQPEQAPQANPLFKTLFEIEEDDSSDSEVEENEAPPPMTLNEAVDELDQPTEVNQEEEKKPEEQVEENTVEPNKAEPKKKKLRKVVDPDIPEDIKPQLNLQDEEPLDEEDEYLNELLPEEQEVYNLAKYASKNMGDEYKGYDVKFKDFFTKSKSFLDKKINDDPHYNPSEDDDYATFIERNRPKLTQVDAKKIERSMWINEAKNEVRKELEPETEKLRKKLERAEKAPAVNQAKSNFRNMAQKVVIPEEYRETFEKGGEEAIGKFAKENPLEYQIMDNASKRLLTYGDTLTDIFLKTVDLDESNAIHKELIDWVNLEQGNFIKSGQTEQDGKVFMRRERYFSLPENRRSEYYTWSDDDLLKILALRTQEQVNSALTGQRDMLKNSGYVKQQVASQNSQEPEVQQVAEKPPVVNTTPRPGNNLNAKTTSKKNNALLNVLGFG
jgi:hypothetical protein